MSSCQKVVKYQKVKHMDYEGGSHKKNKFTQWCSHILMSILMLNMKVTKIGQKYFLSTFLRVFGDHHMWCQNWRQYLCTTLCQLIFSWTSSIV